ncbi:MAG: HAD-IA family hydrolase [Acetobacter sp.]|jgi:predicted HAD superfamily hydrolase
MSAASEILQKWCLDHRWIEDFEAALPTVDAVSFDVFDTALTRSLDAPIDIFALVEQNLVARHGHLFTGYAIWRESAERIARDKAWRRGLREVSFDNILDELISTKLIPENYRRELLETELQAEQDCCFAVPEILNAYDLCRKRNIPTLFVSDMYLSETNIADLLENAGYSAPELLVSCETGCTKSDGSQWDIVRQRLGKKTKILHIGDNDRSDVQTAQKAGLRTLPFKRACSNHRSGGPLTPAILPFSKLLRGETLTSKPQGRNYNPTSATPNQAMKQLSASWGALVAGSYVKWIAERATALGLKHIYFCARDGWLPQRVWNATKLDKTTGISSSYLYVSRRSLNFAAAAVTCSRQHISEQALETLCNVSRAERVCDVLERSGLLTINSLVEDITENLGDLDRRISWDNGVSELKECMRRHASSIYPVLQDRLLAVISYLCQEGVSDGRVGIVDIGWHGTMQASIRNMLRSAGYAPEIFGLYAGLWPGATRNRGCAGWMESAFHNDYQSFDDGLGLYNNVAIIENAFSASEATTIGYKPNAGRMEPILAPHTPSNDLHKTLLSPFQDGTVQQVEKLFSGSVIYDVDVNAITLDAALAAIGRLGLSPNKSEILAAGSIHHSIDTGHMTLTPIVKELSYSTQIGETLDLSHSDWVIGSAMTALDRTDNPQHRMQLLQDIKRQLRHYDHRTLGQFR